MKIRAVSANNHKRVFEVKTAKALLAYPYVKADPKPMPDDRIARLYVDEEVAREGFTYVLESGREGTVHIEQVLEYNKDPGFLRDALLYKLTIEAEKRVAASPLARREIIRRLDTSATQFYRLLDPTNYRKSIDQVLSLLHVLDCDVDLVVRARSA
jgi:hypothetical protein